MVYTPLLLFPVQTPVSMPADEGEEEGEEEEEEGSEEGEDEAGSQKPKLPAHPRELLRLSQNSSEVRHDPLRSSQPVGRRFYGQDRR
jgi:hypothetical protein